MLSNAQNHFLGLKNVTAQMNVGFGGERKKCLCRETLKNVIVCVAAENETCEVKYNVK